MTGFEQWTSGFGRDRSTNWATNTAPEYNSYSTLLFGISTTYAIWNNQLIESNISTSAE